jgi:hypothetical protein
MPVPFRAAILAEYRGVECAEKTDAPAPGRRIWTGVGSGSTDPWRRTPRSLIPYFTIVIFFVNVSPSTISWYT